MPTTAAGPRDARVGDLLPLDRVRARRIDATALLLPGTADTTAYTDALAARADDFAAWDGRVAERPPDGLEAHRLLILDRYGQVYAVHEAATTEELPDADALEEWFRFLATACPECGVIDDPSRYGPTP
ncbi:MAG TPA: hypothetical protein VFH79_10735 [Candidatus Limnocylindria bacterium]|nr:hypothetical protein [Candidatus Limnocylindria bacterium]